MSYELSEAVVTTLPAGADLSGNQYKFVVLDSTAGTARALGSAETDKAIGIQSNVASSAVNTNGVYQFNPTVVLNGVTKLRVDAAYAAGQLLKAGYNATADLNGRGTAAADYIVEGGVSGYSGSGIGGIENDCRAIALQASSAADDIIAVLIVR